MCLLPPARVARGSDSLLHAGLWAVTRWRGFDGGWGDIVLYSAGELLVGADEGVELVEHALLGGAAALAVSQELAA